MNLCGNTAKKSKQISLCLLLFLRILYLIALVELNDLGKFAYPQLQSTLLYHSPPGFRNRKSTAKQKKEERRNKKMNEPLPLGSETGGVSPTSGFAPLPLGSETGGVSPTSGFAPLSGGFFS